MAVDAHIAMLDRKALEGAAREALAEVALAASQAGRGEARGAAVFREGAPARADAEFFTEVNSQGGGTWVTEGQLSRAIETAFHKLADEHGFVVFNGVSFTDDPVMLKVVERLPSLIEARRQSLTEKHIEALVDAFLPAGALTSVMPDIEADNARAQAEFLKVHPILTADELAERAGHSATNRSATANRWKGENKIFAIRVGGREVYPAFQFKDGRPRRSLQKVLATLGSRSGWQTAFWFITPNGWLGGATPIDRLDDEAALATAAAHEVEAWIG